jgi:hypothetical protein
MYEDAIYEPHAILVGIHSGLKNPGDAERLAESMVRLDAIAYAQGRGSLFVVVADPGYPGPNSRDRQRFVAVKESARAAPNLFILVTESTLLRGVITAVSWVSPFSRTSQAVACATFEEAVTRAEGFRPGSAESVRRLERELRTSVRGHKSA